MVYFAPESAKFAEMWSTSTQISTNTQKGCELPRPALDIDPRKSVGKPSLQAARGTKSGPSPMNPWTGAPTGPSQAPAPTRAHGPREFRNADWCAESCIMGARRPSRCAMVSPCTALGEECSLQHDAPRLISMWHSRASSEPKSQVSSTRIRIHIESGNAAQIGNRTRGELRRI